MKRLVPPVILVAVLTVVGGVYARGGPRATDPLHALVRARPDRVFSPRFSIETAYHPCTRDPGSGERDIPLLRCGTNDDAPAFLDDLIAAAAESADPDSLHASGLAGVAWWDRKEASLNEAIVDLSAALALTQNRLGPLVDLSAAHLVRAQHTQNSQDLVKALDYAREGLAIDPRNLPARYNAGLALEALGVVDQAVKEWSAYLALDATSGWAGEARERRAALLKPREELLQPTAASTDAELQAFVARDPGRARQVALDSILGEWGKAVQEGDTARANPLLGLVDRMVAALERQSDDRTLADMAHAIHIARNDPAATRTLAGAHRAYAEGQAAFTSRHTDAHASFERVIRARPASPVLVAWARAFYAGTLIYQKNSAAGTRILDSLVAHVDSLSYPVITARVRWMKGTALLRQQRPSEAAEQFAAAAESFQRHRELKSHGAVLNLQGWATHATGDTIEGYKKLHAATLALSPYRKSARLQTVLMELADVASKDGMQHAALAIQEECLSISVHADDPALAMESLQQLARFRATLGDNEQAARDLDSAAVLATRLADADERKAYMRNLLRYSRVLVQTGGSRTSEAELDAALAFFTGNNAVWRLIVLMRRADLRLASGNLAGASIDLDSITAQFQRLSKEDPKADIHTRGAIIEQARGRFDKLVMLYVHARREREALRVLERGRLSMVPMGRGAAPVPARLAAPQGHVALEYALVGDTLLTWVLRDTVVVLLRDTVNRGELLASIRHLNTALERSRPAAEALLHQHRLYDLLIRPAASRIPPGARLLIVADGEIAGLPFAGLRDSARGEFLVEKHVLRIASTLADAARPAPSGDGLPVLLVANPAFDQAYNSRLERLRGAGREVDSLATVYPGARELRDALATAGALVSQAQRSGMIHYAGHAVFDDTRPEHSFLLLAGSGADGWLNAAAVGSLDLSRTRLVVLSACRTLRSRAGRSGGFAGLSGAFLSAGAGGVVGSLWEVSDSLTQPLMVRFHRAYRESGDAAAALQIAQLAMLRSGDPMRRSPAAWAGFRYAGAEPRRR